MRTIGKEVWKAVVGQFAFASLCGFFAFFAVYVVFKRKGRKVHAEKRKGKQVELAKCTSTWKAGMLNRARTAMLACLMGSMLLIACNTTRSGETSKSNEPPSRTTPMPSNSPTPIVGPIKYLALGDSTGAGIGAKEGGYVARLFKRILAVRAGSDITNLCVSGATTSDVLRNQLQRGLRENPNFVTLGIGINDIGHGLSVEQFSKNYEEILGTLKNSTSATIVLTNIPDISTAPRIPEIVRPEYQQLIIQFNGRLEEIAARHGVIVFDVYTITREELPAHPEFFSADGFHPSDQGYELWAEKMWPTVARAIGEGAGR